MTITAAAAAAVAAAALHSIHNRQQKLNKFSLLFFFNILEFFFNFL